MNNPGHAGTRGALASYAAVGLVQKGGAFILLPIVAASVTISEYGQIALLLAATGVLNVVMTFGMEGATFRAHFATTGEARRAYLVSVGLACRAAPLAMGGTLACLCAAHGGRILRLPWDLAACECVAAGLLAGGTTFAYGTLRANRNFARYSWIAISTFFVTSASKLLLVVALGLSVQGWVLSDLAGGAWAFINGLVVVRLPGPLTGNISGRALREAAAYSLPLVPHLVAFWALALSDRIILSRYVPLSEIANYSIAYQLVGTGTLLLAEANRALMPEYGEYLHKRAQSALVAAVRLHIRIIAAVVATAAVASKVFLTLFLPSFPEAAPFLFPLVLGGISLALYSVPMNIMTIVCGNTRWVPVTSVSVAALNVSLNFALAPHFGAMGSAWITVVTNLLLLVGILCLERRQPLLSNLSPSALLGRSGLALIVSLAATILLMLRGTTLSLVLAAAGAIVCVGGVVAELRQRATGDTDGATPTTAAMQRPVGG